MLSRLFARRLALGSGLVSSALLAAIAPAPVRAADPPAKISTLVVFGEDPCPKSSGDEIVVCARYPESDRYRLPKRFRHSKPDVSGESWVNRAATLDMVSRDGLPDSCSPSGSGGQTGCFRKFREQWAAEQRQAKADAAETP